MRSKILQNISACLDVATHLHVLNYAENSEYVCSHHTLARQAGAQPGECLAVFLHHPEYMDNLLRS